LLKVEKKVWDRKNREIGKQENGRNVLVEASKKQDTHIHSSFGLRVAEELVLSLLLAAKTAETADEELLVLTGDDDD